ncbi:MAG: hypothetical protein ACU837_03545 [Gammaproteobacteria bacterium]
MINKNEKDADLRGLKIAEWALGIVFVGAVTLFFVGPDRIYFFIDSFFQADREIQAAYQARLENLKLQMKRNERQEELDRIKSEQQEQRRLEEKQRQQQQILAKIMKADAVSKEKQAKWERFYRQSPGCKEPKKWKQKVECADELMRAEERFEALYREGKL